MPEPFKERYTPEALRTVATDLQAAYSPFDVDAFLASVFDETWQGLELKDRIYRISESLGTCLPADYRQAIQIIDQVVANYGSWLEGFGAFFPIFVEMFGQDERDWDISMAALARYTPYASSEIAVRPFIITHEQRAMAQMNAWSKNQDELVRRLSSEGCRPRLPWAPAIRSFKKDPSPILPILEQLKADPSEHVRKSVANNLNDISKTHPELVIALAKDWLGRDPKTDWIVKHGCRTLLKQGHAEALELFGFGGTAIQVEGFALLTPSVQIGSDLTFAFTVQAEEEATVRLEYGIDYMKANGKTSRKVFKISEVELQARKAKTYTRSHSFAKASTRRLYPGTHSVTLIVNGSERGTLEFELEG